ncbi:MAG: AmmeMemoRadiSam system protein B [bacterium]|jgi:AmmeMemoRadiSam system protein B
MESKEIFSKENLNEKFHSDSFDFYKNVKLKARYLDVKPIVFNNQNLFLISDPYKISPDIIVNPIVVLVLSLLDGSNYINDIKSEIFKNTGIMLYDSELYELIKFFDDNLFLLNDKFYNVYNKEIEDLKSRGVLKGNLMGISYPEDPDKAEEFLFSININDSINELNFDNIFSDIIALIVPHMDLRVARDTYFKAYKILLDNIIQNNRVIENVFILGVSHYYHKNPISVFPLDFETPFGILKINKELIKKISLNLKDTLKDSYFDLFEDILIYKSEHSIEAQVPYIKLLEKKLADKNNNLIIKVIPMIISYGNIDLFSKIIDSFINEIDVSKTIFISSIDLSHVGKKFGDKMSFDPKYYDQKYLDLLLSLKTEDLFYFDNVSKIDGIFTNTFLTLLLNRISEINNIKINAKVIDYKKYEEKLMDSIVSYASVIYFKQ